MGRVTRLIFDRRRLRIVEEEEDREMEKLVSLARVTKQRRLNAGQNPSSGVSVNVSSFIPQCFVGVEAI